MNILGLALAEEVLFESLFEYHIEFECATSEQEKKVKKYHVQQCCIALEQMAIESRRELTSVSQ